MDAAAPPTRHPAALSAVPGRWRGLVGLVALAVVGGAIALLFGLAATVVDLATGAQTPEGLAAGRVTLTPAVMLANNLSLAALIPASMLLQWAIFGVRPGHLSSLVGRFRWRLLLRLAAVIAPVWVVYVAAMMLVEPIEAAPIGAASIAMVAIVLLTTPLQSAGEEYGFRGFVQRCVGSWFRGPRLGFAVATFVSSVAFAIVHLSTDPWLIAYYLVFGAAMAYAAWGTGGLEAPVLIHAVNNLLLLVPVALLGQTDGVFEREAGVGSAAMLVPMALVSAAAWFCVRRARRGGAVVEAPPATGFGRPRPAAPCAQTSLG